MTVATTRSSSSPFSLTIQPTSSRVSRTHQYQKEIKRSRPTSPLNSPAGRIIYSPPPPPPTNTSPIPRPCAAPALPTAARHSCLAPLPAATHLTPLRSPPPPSSPLPLHCPPELLLNTHSPRMPSRPATTPSPPLCLQLLTLPPAPLIFCIPTVLLCLDSAPLVSPSPRSPLPPPCRADNRLIVTHNVPSSAPFASLDLV